MSTTEHGSTTDVDVSRDGAMARLESTEAGRAVGDVTRVMRDLKLDERGPLSSVYKALMSTMGLATTALIVDSLGQRLTGKSLIDSAGSQIKTFTAKWKAREQDSGVPGEDQLKSGGFLTDLINAIKGDVGKAGGAVGEQAKPAIEFLESLAKQMGFDGLSGIPGVQEVKSALQKSKEALGTTETGKLLFGAGKPAEPVGAGIGGKPKGRGINN